MEADALTSSLAALHLVQGPGAALAAHGPCVEDARLVDQAVVRTCEPRALNLTSTFAEGAPPSASEDRASDASRPAELTLEEQWHRPPTEFARPPPGLISLYERWCEMRGVMCEFPMVAHLSHVALGGGDVYPCKSKTCWQAGVVLTHMKSCLTPDCSKCNTCNQIVMVCGGILSRLRSRCTAEAVFVSARAS